MARTLERLLVAVTVLLLVELHVVQGVDYVGGWLPGSASRRQCVDICVNSKAAPTCPTSDPACLAKKQRTGDYDYLMLEQIFVPQFCRDLLKGTDTTVSHQNVNAYPSGVTCTPDVVNSELTIHGLWPNYNNGYAGCCNVSESVGNHPFNAASFAKNQPALLKEMAVKWIDPTQSDAFDTLCEIYNHEFQKHGLCYTASGMDYETAAVTYFKATLKAAKTLQKATKQITKWASAKKAQIPSLAALEALFSNKLQVFCSGVDETKNRLSAIRTCFEKPAVAGDAGHFKQADCAPAAAQGTLVLCDPKVPISLEGYMPPGKPAYQQSA
ncbi:Ribonuclease [Globisporangium polare]